jgi:hypothetical protein
MASPAGSSSPAAAAGGGRVIRPTPRGCSREGNAQERRDARPGGPAGAESSRPITDRRRIPGRRRARTRRAMSRLPCGP